MMNGFFERILTDSDRGVDRPSWQLDSESLPSYEGPPWSVRKFKLRGGKQEGVQLVQIDNGAMALTLVPTRGMNVLEGHTDRTRLGWDSPVRQVVHPAYVQEESRGGLGWLEGFNELVARCGLENTGAPGPDTITDNEGNEATIELPLHGRISNIPASKLWVRVELESPHRIVVGGDVYDTRMFGPSYRLRTEIVTVPGETSFDIVDEVTNVSGVPVDFELLYHCNYGPPLLGKGSRLVAPVKRVAARDECALSDIETWDRFDGPRAGFVEQCYFLSLHADEQDTTSVALVGPEQELAVRLTYSASRLPAFTLWKNTAAESDGYVTGLEPGTDYPNARRFEREQGRVLTLEPHQTYEAGLTMELVEGSPAVRSTVSEIKDIGRDKPSEISPALDQTLSPA
jgi:hypothetical protein